MAFGDHVQSVFTDNPGTPSAVALGTVTVGNLLWVMSAAAGNNAAAVEDDLGNNFQLAESHHDVGADYRVDVFFAVVEFGGACTIQITHVGGAREAIRAEYEGPFDAAPLDAVNSAAGTGTSASSGTDTPEVAGELVIGGIASAGAITESGSFGPDRAGSGTSANLLAESFVQGAPAAVAATAAIAPSSLWLALLTTFKPQVSEEAGAGRPWVE